MKKNPYEVVVNDVLAVRKNERALIIANPNTNQIAQNFYLALEKVGAIPSLIIQPDKTSFDNANKEVIAAIKSNPDVCFSISNIKLGKDSEAAANPYKTEDGQEFSHIFDYLLDGKKSMRTQHADAHDFLGAGVVGYLESRLRLNHTVFPPCWNRKTLSRSPHKVLGASISSLSGR